MEDLRFASEKCLNMATPERVKRTLAEPDCVILERLPVDEQRVHIGVLNPVLELEAIEPLSR